MVLFNVNVVKQKLYFSESFSLCGPSLMLVQSEIYVRFGKQKAFVAIIFWRLSWLDMVRDNMEMSVSLSLSFALPCSKKQI